MGTWGLSVHKGPAHVLHPRRREKCLEYRTLAGPSCTDKPQVPMAGRGGASFRTT